MMDSFIGLLSDIAPDMSEGDMIVISHKNSDSDIYSWQKDCPHCLYLTEPEQHRKEMCRECLAQG